MDAGSVRFLISDGVLKEINAGRPDQELKLLHQLSTRVILRNGDISPCGDFATWSLDDVTTAERATKIEIFLIDILRLMSGKTPENPIEEHFKTVMDWIYSQIRNTAKELGSADRTLVDFVLGEVSFPATAEIDTLASFRIFDEEMRKMRIGSDHLSNIVAPHVVKKILARLPADFRKSLEQIFGPIDDITTIRNRLQSAGLLLVILGFGRDNRIRKEAEIVSLKGAVSQWYDVEHIASAAGCTLFLTSDKNCAKLAHALYENFQIPTIAAYLVRSDTGFTIRALGPNFWP